MRFVVRQDGLLQSMNKLLNRLVFAGRNFVECHPLQWLGSGYMQRLIQVGLGNVVNMRDNVNCHPGSVLKSCDIVSSLFCAIHIGLSGCTPYFCITCRSN